MSKPLTPKQSRFVEEFLIDLNATQAAIRAGYSEKTAHSQGPRLLENVEVASAIQSEQAKRSEGAEWNAQKVRERLQDIAELDVADILMDDGSLMPIKQWPKAWRTSISGFDVMEIGSQGDAIGVVKKVKWPDRLKNLELLGKHVDVRAFGDKQQDSTVDLEEQLSLIMAKLGGSLPN